MSGGAFCKPEGDEDGPGNPHVCANNEWIQVKKPLKPSCKEAEFDSTGVRCQPSCTSGWKNTNDYTNDCDSGNSCCQLKRTCPYDQFYVCAEESPGTNWVELTAVASERTNICEPFSYKCYSLQDPCNIGNQRFCTTNNCAADNAVQIAGNCVNPSSNCCERGCVFRFTPTLNILRQQSTSDYLAAGDTIQLMMTQQGTTCSNAQITKVKAQFKSDQRACSFDVEWPASGSLQFLGDSQSVQLAEIPCNHVDVEATATEIKLYVGSGGLHVLHKTVPISPVNVKMNPPPLPCSESLGLRGKGCAVNANSHSEWVSESDFSCSAPNPKCVTCKDNTYFIKSEFIDESGASSSRILSGCCSSALSCVSSSGNCINQGGTTVVNIGEYTRARCGGSNAGKNNWALLSTNKLT